MGGARRGGRRRIEVTQELVEEERERLVKERQGDVQRVLDKHDDLVSAPIGSYLRGLTVSQIREAFHLEKFVSYIGFDPKVRNVLPHEGFFQDRIYAPGQPPDRVRFYLTLFLGGESGQVERLP